jgi:hypothetical protein
MLKRQNLTNPQPALPHAFWVITKIMGSALLTLKEKTCRVYLFNNFALFKYGKIASVL